MAYRSPTAPRRPHVDSCGNIEPGNAPNRAVQLILALAWLAVLGPRLTQSLTSTKAANFSVAAAGEYSNLALLVGSASTIALLGGCCAVILASIVRGTLPVQPRRLVIATLPALVVMVGSAYSYGSVQTSEVSIALMALALWLSRPSLTDAAVIGYLTGVLAALSILLGAFLPRIGILIGASGQLVLLDKGLGGFGLLIGPYTHPNSLGQAIALGIPAILVVKNRKARFVLLFLSAVCILWTLSRTSFLALIASFLVVAVVKLIKSSRMKSAIGGVSILVLATAGVVLPLIETSSSAYSGRGAIWLGSIAAANEHPITGLGPEWYEVISHYANDLLSVASHGHNQFVTSYTTGGIVLVATFVVLFATASVVANRTASSGAGVFPLLFILTCLVIFSQESPAGFVGFGSQFSMFWTSVLLIVLAAPAQSATARQVTVTRTPSKGTPPVQLVQRINGIRQP